jgi:hypothetical protein
MHEIQADIEAFAKNVALSEEANFARRAEAIDDLEFHIIDRIDALLQAPHPPAGLIALKQQAERVKRRLEAVDERLFRRLRADIRAGGRAGAALKELIHEYVGHGSGGRRPQGEIGYDTLDVFVNGLLRVQAIPDETRAREPEMVSYQQTPARVILELAEQAQLTGEDLFYDLGSGLGHIPMLVHLLSGAPARGVEIEPAYCDYARECAESLALSGVAIIQADARTVDYSDGTVFFMYTPFTGGIMQAVLQKLRREPRSRPITLFTYGPCTAQVARQDWLRRIDRNGDRHYQLSVFRGRGSS